MIHTARKNVVAVVGASYSSVTVQVINLCKEIYRKIDLDSKFA